MGRKINDQFCKLFAEEKIEESAGYVGTTLITV